ncbi:MAG: hypothetical protein WD558_08600 [Pseudomonadales bacterium]
MEEVVDTHSYRELAPCLLPLIEALPLTTMLGKVIRIGDVVLCGTRMDDAIGLNHK